MLERALQIALVTAPLILFAYAEEHSALWGSKGEAWDPAGRLPDVSFAGYACGERPISIVAAETNVRDFGAKGDGTTDDTAAFLAAIEKTQSGAIIVPAGRYRIIKILEINKPGIVLRGEGPAHSILVCPVPLNDIRPDWGATTTGKRTSNYSWSGGIVWFNGANGGRRIGRCSTPAKRGNHELKIEGDTSALSAGDRIEITVRDDSQKSLLTHLYSDDPGDLSRISASKHRTTFVTRVTRITGQILTLERPLRIDLRPEWNPEISLYLPTVTNSGIEGLGFEFPERKYEGHFSELGFNAIAFSNVADCWARNLVFTNSDSGIFAGGRFCTIENVRCQLTGVSETNGVFGHHGITLSGHDNLLSHFEIRQRYVHDISVEGGAGNVASAGSGTDLCFDHHKRAPYDNVFTDIDLGAGTRMWKCGGGADLGRHCAAHGTFWNIRAAKGQKYPEDFGPASMNLVALETKEKSVTEPNGRWFEAIPPASIEPANIYQAQLNRRLGGK
ncbi:MAG: glycosyl hydrolase family 28-related protein [Luteolibacter sp.]